MHQNDESLSMVCPIFMPVGGAFGTVTAGEYAPCENEYANVAIVTVGIELQVISRGHRDRASREPHVAARSMLLFLHAGPDCRCRWPARAAYRPGTGS